MTDFPSNFDYIIFGTGVTESILSSALSVIGRTVLHIDKKSYYGGSNACLRLSELEETLNNWIINQLPDIGGDLFCNTESQVSFVEYLWHVKKEDIPDEINGMDIDNTPHHCLTENVMRQRLRGFEFELIPKLVYCESQTVDALIQSDVTRYLDFKFVSKFASISDDKIINIPINRSDIVKTRVFSLRQKRQLTSFLEWCFNISPDDELLKKYVDKPLYELMRCEKNIDFFTENIIIQCLALSSPDVKTMEGTMQIKRLLKSFNKFGPYPIMWPNYGSGEISQAFCRMSAVFGGIYCLNTSIQSCSHQEALNGHETTQESVNTVPTSHRKLKLRLSNDNEVYTDKIVCSKAYTNSMAIVDRQATRWVCRCILVTDRSLLDSGREPNDILMLPLQLECVTRPAILLELPTDRRSETSSDIYVTHLIAYTTSLLDAKILFSEVIGKNFCRYGDSDIAEQGTQSSKPNIVFECYFTMADLSDVIVDVTLPQYADICKHTLFVRNSLDSLEFDDSVKEAREIFSVICPGEEFLPRPPNPEDIILLGDEVVQLGSQTAGDFPFESDVDGAMSSNTPLPATAAGEQSPSEALSGPTISGLLAEMNLEATVSELDEQEPPVAMQE